MNYYIGSMKCKYAFDKPIVSGIRPVQVETNLTEYEIKSFKEVIFFLKTWWLIFFQSLFKGERSILINRLVDEMLWPTTCISKAVCQTIPFKMSNLHCNWWEASWLLEANVNPLLKVPSLGYGQIYKILSSQNPNKR